MRRIAIIGAGSIVFCKNCCRRVMKQGRHLPDIPMKFELTYTPSDLTPARALAIRDQARLTKQDHFV